MCICVYTSFVVAHRNILTFTQNTQSPYSSEPSRNVVSSFSWFFFYLDVLLCPSCIQAVIRGVELDVVPFLVDIDIFM